MKPNKLFAFILFFAIFFSNINSIAPVFAQTAEQEKLRQELQKLEQELAAEQRKLEQQRAVTGSLSKEVAEKLQKKQKLLKRLNKKDEDRKILWPKYYARKINLIIIR